MTSIPPEKLKVGKALLAGGPITQEMLARELDRSQKSGSVLGKALLQSGFPREEEVIYPLLARLRIPRINAKNTKIPLETVRLIPEEVAKRRRVLPLDQVGSILIVVTPNVGDEDAMTEVRKVTGLLVSPIQSDPKTCSPDEFDAIVKDYYGRLRESGLAPAPTPDGATPVGTTTGGAPVGANGKVQAIPAGSEDQDAFWKAYMSAGPVPARETLM